jgi:hypothetical protein
MSSATIRDNESFELPGIAFPPTSIYPSLRKVLLSRRLPGGFPAAGEPAGIAVLSTTKV